MKYQIIILSFLLFSMACNDDHITNQNSEGQTILSQLAGNYSQLPEQAISRSLDNRVYAQYAKPTEKYGHGILGDGVEAEQLVVVVDSIFYELTLQSNYVFEDIRPRLFDVDGDDELEFITIRTNVSKGAGVVIYKLVDGELVEYAKVGEIGIAYRWLNVVAINDLDNDGIVELVWIQTPHIGGILKVAKINAGTLHVLDEKAPYSNHAIGERNLCLSVLTEQADQKIFYVPNQSRDKIVGFSFKNNDLSKFEEIDLPVNFSETLFSQYGFTKPIEDEINCVLGE